MKKCPYCAEKIKTDAIVCRYCGRELPQSSVPFENNNVKKARTKWVKACLWAACVGIGTCLIGFLAYKIAFDWWPVFVSPLKGELVYSDATGMSEGFNKPPDGSDIFIVAANGSNLHNLTNSRCSASWKPSFSPDGKKIAFISSGCEGSDGGLYIMDNRGTYIRKITDLIYGHNYYDWSPDGSRIVFDSYDLDSNISDIWVVDVDGTEPQNLTNSQEQVLYQWPRWSPNGSEIIFVRGEDIYRMNSDGSDLTRLTQNDNDNDFPAWSPDGTQIAFIAQHAEGIDLVVMDADGSNPTVLVPGSLAEDTPPTWSPEGTRLMYQKADQHYQENIYIASLNGSEDTAISVCHQCWVISPGWSPDGKWMIYTKLESTHSDIAMRDYSNYEIDLYNIQLGREKILKALGMEGLSSVDHYEPDWSR